MKSFLLSLLLTIILSCGQEATSQTTSAHKVVKPQSTTVLVGKTIATRFSPPTGFERITVKSNSYAAYLQNLPLKPAGSTVTYFDGSTKSNQGVYVGVVDLPIGKRDLHQCADAVMRLRAEYLYEQGLFEEIHFNLTNGFQMNYANWRRGQRLRVKGNKTYWITTDQASETYESFWEYLEMVFAYAGTHSLAKELSTADLQQLAIGDVFIQGGFPGHAVLVVDLAIHPETGEKCFLLAQSYMPAQEIQILANPNDSDKSPWYNTEFDTLLRTPEWTFKASDLKRF